MSNALPSSMSNVNVPVAPASRTWAVSIGGVAPANQPSAPQTPKPPRPRPLLTVAPPPRVGAAAAGDPARHARPHAARPRAHPRQRPLRACASAATRSRSSSTCPSSTSRGSSALAFGQSPHVYYDEVRAERARALLREGFTESEAAHRVGFRRPAELRALLAKRAEPDAR